LIRDSLLWPAGTSINDLGLLRKLAHVVLLLAEVPPRTHRTRRSNLSNTPPPSGLMTTALRSAILRVLVWQGRRIMPADSTGLNSDASSIGSQRTNPSSHT